MTHHTPSGLQRLIAGYTRFRRQYFTGSDLYADLVKRGQRPKTMVIACSDSRVDPSIVFNSKPGELFVVRNVANLVPPCDESPKHHGTSAALEFAVQTLGVKDIVIMGHSQCGGIAALLKGQPEAAPKSFISSWMRIAATARDKTLQACGRQSMACQVTLCEQHALRISLANLRTFSWIDARVKAGTLHLHALYFELKSGRIMALDQATDTFVPL